MIKYRLKCASDHQFEGWFSNSADYDEQLADNMLECPTCGTSQIEKALMAPALARTRAISTSSRTEEKLAAIRRDWNEAASKARDYVEKNFDNVGKKFPEEARRIHYGETKERPIFGEATKEEVGELVEEGIEVAPVPQPLPAEGDVKKKLN